MTTVSPLSIPGPGNAPTEPRRVAPRSNMFVVATLASNDKRGPVRIRNMSLNGALIEGADIPPANGALRLSRGSLSVTGTVIWSNDGRAGVRFDSAIVPSEWLPNGKHATGQQRIDEIVHCLKTRTKVPVAATSPVTADSAPFSTSLDAALTDISAMLSQAAAELAEDPAIAQRHLTALQLIDVAAQKLSALVNGRVVQSAPAV